MLEALADVDTVAKATFTVAIVLAVVASILLVAISFSTQVSVSWDGTVRIVNGTYKVIVTRAPFNRPTIDFLTKDKLASIQLISFNDINSYYKGNEIASNYVPKIKLNGSKVVIDYGPFKKIVYVTEKHVVIELLNFSRGVIGFSIAGAKSLKFNKTEIAINDLKGPFDISFNVTLRFEGCEVETPRATPFKGILSSKWIVQVGLRCKERGYIIVSSTQPKISLLGKITIYALSLMSLYVPIGVAALGIVVWRKWLSKNLRTFKGAAVFALFLIFISAFSGHHWDLLMAYYFGKLVYEFKDPYQWTFDLSMFMRSHTPVSNSFFPGYAYLPQMLPFFLPLYLLYKLLISENYVLFLSKDALKLADQYSFIFKLGDTFLYYTIAHAYFYAFMFLSAYLVHRYYDKDKAFLLLYSFLPLTILVEWGMYECFMLPFLIGSLILIKSKNDKKQFFSGLLWSLGSSKIYPALSVPALLYYSSSRLLWLAGFLLGQLPTFYFLLKEPMTFLSCTILFHINRNIGDINYFPSFLGNPLSLLWYAKLGSVAEVLFLLLTYVLIVKYKPRVEAAAALSLVPFVLFNRLVSPQHYLTLGTLALLSGDALTFTYLGVFVFLHVNLVRPSILYLAYHWLDLTITSTHYTYASLNNIIFTIMMNNIPSLAWPIVFVFLVATDVRFYVEALRGGAGEEGLGSR